MFAFLTGGSASSTIRTIDRLLSRVQHSTVIDEKIDALQQLAGLPLADLTECRVSEVLTKALVEIVENDHQRDDEDVCSEIMKTLAVLTSDLAQNTAEMSPDEPFNSTANVKEYAATNAEMILDSERLFATFHNCLCEPRAIAVRLFTLRLILNSLKFQRPRVQECVINHSGFVKSVVEILAHSPEILRNESILLLEALVHDNPTIQNIAVFDGVFEILLEIVADEGGSGVVACDCYRLIASLLEGIDSNVKYFGELGCINRIPKILGLAFQGLSSGTESHIETRTDTQESPRSEIQEISSKKSLSVQSFELLVAVISQACRIAGSFQSQLFSRNMADAIYPFVGNDAVTVEMKCSLLRVVGRSLVGCQSARSVFSDFTISSCPLTVYHLRLALNGADVNICSNALFVLESYFYMNDTAQVSAVSTLAPAPESDSDTTELFGTELVQSLSRWRNDIKCLGDCLLFWTACRILVLITRRNDVAKQIAVTTALSVPLDDRPAPRLLDNTIRTIQVAFDSSHADARVRISLFLILCEVLIQSQEAVHVLVQSSHLTETLLSGQSWKSGDPIISGLACLVWAFCLDVADPESYNDLLHRIIMVQIGVDVFKSCLSRLRSAPEFKDPRPEMSYEPMLLTQLRLFDSYFVEQANRVIDLCDSRILTLVISRDDSVPIEPKMIPSALISDELIAARSRITELESDLASALKGLADKTDEAALTRYRLDLAQKELSNLTEGKQHASFEELQQGYEQLQSEHEELKSQYADLMVLLASLESEREMRTVTQKIDERIERSQNDEVFLI